MGAYLWVVVFNSQVELSLCTVYVWNLSQHYSMCEVMGGLE